MVDGVNQSSVEIWPQITPQGLTIHSVAHEATVIFQNVWQQNSSTSLHQWTKIQPQRCNFYTSIASAEGQHQLPSELTPSSACSTFRCNLWLTGWDTGTPGSSFVKALRDPTRPVNFSEDPTPHRHRLEKRQMVHESGWKAVRKSCQNMFGRDSLRILARLGWFLMVSCISCWEVSNCWSPIRHIL